MADRKPTICRFHCDCCLVLCFVSPVIYLYLLVASHRLPTLVGAPDLKAFLEVREGPSRDLWQDWLQTHRVRGGEMTRRDQGDDAVGFSQPIVTQPT